VRKKINGEFRFLGHETESAKLAREIMERLKFSNEMIGQITHLILHHMSMVGYDAGWNDGAMRRLIRRVGSENVDQLLAFRKADILAHGIEDERMGRFSELKERIESLRRRGLVIRAKDLAIHGGEVMEILGLSEGPEVGTILEQLVDRVTDHPELNTKEALVVLLEEMRQTNDVKGG
jgi:poly(A) polymerase/tRNA nucleotidyltransferase (CCA-adding enzyme)